ncbi:MAG: hypothetical protein RIR46_1069 [Actinomycetota bacterium]|jgi:predicted lipid-binding transport protein (Tim44 family)
MGLSEREQKVLEELERGLYAEDAKFATKVSAGPNNSAARIVAGALLTVVGLSILVFAVVSQLTVFGVVGFALMLAGVLVATSSSGGKAKGDAKPAAKPRVSPTGTANQRDQTKGSFFEERWNKRMDQ